jgi:murein DD-endopeptidase MepM/ murein hydrolase activator NlpD
VGSSAKTALLVLLLAALTISFGAMYSRFRAGGNPYMSSFTPIPRALPRSGPLTPVAAGITSDNMDSADDMQLLLSRRLVIPVQGVDRVKLRDNYSEMRGGRRHEALDIMAPRGTPVLAVDEGRVAKLFESKAGGITVYQFDRDEKFAYYYAHLDHYADGLKEGVNLKRGEVLGFVGTSGNATPGAPHLHFTIFRLGPDRRWWKGTALNPYPFLNQTAD